jgi:hypothetical protein
LRPMTRLTAEQVENRAHEALAVLTDTDEEAARLKFIADEAEQRYKATVDTIFLHEEGPVEIRKAKARHEAEPLYVEFLKARQEFDALANRRKSSEIVVDWLRSLYANVRQGK